jgi:hypothetical protein
MLAGAPLRLIEAVGPDGLEAILPLCCAPGRFGRWRVPGSQEVFEPVDALYRDAEAAHRLARRVGEHRLGQRDGEIRALGRERGMSGEPLPAERQRRQAVGPAEVIGGGVDRRLVQLRGLQRRDTPEVLRKRQP